MATYNPPQPMWKRNVAGILDFLLVFLVGGYILSKTFGNTHGMAPHFGPNTNTVELFSLTGWSVPVLLGVIIAYFVILGRTGGTVFQRVFGMKRAK